MNICTSKSLMIINSSFMWRNVLRFQFPRSLHLYRERWSVPSVWLPGGMVPDPAWLRRAVLLLHGTLIQNNPRSQSFIASPNGRSWRWKKRGLANANTIKCERERVRVCACVRATESWLTVRGVSGVVFLICGLKRRSEQTLHCSNEVFSVLCVCAQSEARALLVQRKAGKVKTRWEMGWKYPSRVLQDKQESLEFLPLPPTTPFHSSSPVCANTLLPSSPIPLFIPPLYRSSSSSSFLPLKHKTLVILMIRACPEGMRHGESTGEEEEMTAK